VAVHVSRIGLTPLKGARHLARRQVTLDPDGPVGDRAFGLVDPVRGRLLRTVEDRTLLQTMAGWADGRLTVTLPTERADGVPTPTGQHLKVDYWGRAAAVEVVDGPWAAAYSRHLGRDVVLTRSREPGEIVYGASVSILTSSSLDRLAREVGGPVDPAQFRATVSIDTAGEPAHVEDSWVGRRLRLGDAEVEVRGPIPRCAVVDLDPATGERRADVLRCLGGYRRVQGEIHFGVDAVVTRPGRVDLGAAVERG
jgi:uncharacterized protein YcbX